MVYKVRDVQPSLVAVKCAVGDCSAEARGQHETWQPHVEEFPGSPWHTSKRPLCQHHRRLNNDYVQTVERFTLRHSMVHPNDAPHWKNPGANDCTRQCHHDPSLVAMWMILDVYGAILYSEDVLPAGGWVSAFAHLPIGARLEEAYP